MPLTLSLCSEHFLFYCRLNSKSSQTDSHKSWVLYSHTSKQNPCTNNNHPTSLQQFFRIISRIWSCDDKMVSLPLSLLLSQVLTVCSDLKMARRFQGSAVRARTRGTVCTERLPLSLSGPKSAREREAAQLTAMNGRKRGREIKSGRGKNGTRLSGRMRKTKTGQCSSLCLSSYFTPFLCFFSYDFLSVLHPISAFIPSVLLPLFLSFIPPVLLLPSEAV